MNQSTRREDLPGEVLADVASAVGAQLTPVARLSGGINAGAVRVQVAGRADAALKAEPLSRLHHLDEVLRARRVVDHVRSRGYPTPAWLAVGATATHVWSLVDFVDAAPPAQLTPSVVEQLMDIVELQAGQGTGAHDHWAYAWRVVTGREPVATAVSGYSGEVAALVQRALRVCVGAAPPTRAPDMVHADLNPGNVLVREGVVVAVIDIGNAGRGTRATDLTTLVWHTVHDPLEAVRGRVWARLLAVVGWEEAALLTATRVLMELEWPTRLARHDLVPAALQRGHRVLDELDALR